MTEVKMRWDGLQVGNQIQYFNFEYYEVVQIHDNPRRGRVVILRDMLQTVGDEYHGFYWDMQSQEICPCDCGNRDDYRWFNETNKWFVQPESVEVVVGHLLAQGVISEVVASRITLAQGNTNG